MKLISCRNCPRQQLRFSAAHPNGLRAKALAFIGWNLRRQLCPACAGAVKAENHEGTKDTKGAGQ